MSSNLNIVAMHRSEALREELSEAFWQRKELELDYGDAMQDLREADPEGWEAWYDDKLPDFRWKDEAKVREAIERIRKHIKDVLADES